MYYTPNLKLTQYEMNDKFNPLEQYNRDMEIIDVTTTSISNAVIKVVEDSGKNYSEFRADINVNTASISAMEMRLVNAEDDIKVNKEESEKAINALQVTTSSISATIMQHIVTSTSVVAGIYETIDTKYEELKTQQLADEQRIAVNETAIANHQELLDKLNLDGTETGDAIEELQEAVQALQNIDSSTAESIQDLRTRMSSAEANITTDGTDIDALETRMTTAEQNIEDLSPIYPQKLPNSPILFVFNDDYGDAIATIPVSNCYKDNTKVMTSGFAGGTFSTSYGDIGQAMIKNAPGQNLIKANSVVLYDLDITFRGESVHRASVTKANENGIVKIYGIPDATGDKEYSVSGILIIFV